MSLVNEFAIQTEKTFRDFDSNSFVQASRSVLMEEATAMDVNANYSGIKETLDNASTELSNVFMNQAAFKTFVRQLENSPRLDVIGSFPEIYRVTTSFNFNYLKDYKQNLTVAVDKLIQKLRAGEDPRMAVVEMKTIADRLSSATKMQIVRGGNPDTAPAQWLQKEAPLVPYNKEYILNNVIPFIDSFTATKGTLLSQISELRVLIDSFAEESAARNRVLGEFCNTNPEICNQVNPVMYKLNRGALDVLSYATYHVAKAVHEIVSNVHTCERVHTAMVSISRPVRTIMTEGAFEDMTTLSNRTSELSESLSQGNASAYIDFANRVYEFHKNIISRFCRGEDPEGQLNDFLNRFEYNKEPYNTVLEITTIIGKSVDTMIASTEDYMLQFDEILDKAELAEAVDTRYAGHIKLITDTSQYDNATEIAVNGSGNIQIYGVLVREIRDFPDNMQLIVNAIRDLNEKVTIFEDRLENNINCEFNNSHAVNELKDYCGALSEQIQNLVTGIAGNFMIRLRKLATNAERISVKLENIQDEPWTMTESVDYAYEVDKMVLEYEQDLTDVMMDTLYTEFQKAHMKKYRHLDVYTEANATANAAAGNPPTPAPSSANASGMNQAQSATVNAQKKAAITNKLNSTKETLHKNFTDMVTRYRADMNALPLAQTINANAPKIKSRSYQNLNMEILPYASRMPFTQVITEVEKFQSTVTAFSAANVNSMHTDKDILARLYAGQGITVIDGDLAAIKKDAGEKLRNYYKIGKGTLQMASYNNDDLKNMMTSIADFCENYYRADQERLLQSITGIETALAGMGQSFITESVDAIMEKVSLMLEAPGDPQTQTQQPNTKPKVTTTNSNTQTTQGNQNGETTTNAGMTPGKMFDTLQSGCLLYAGSVLNAVRDRVKDYASAIDKFVTTANTQTANANQTQTPQA